MVSPYPIRLKRLEQLSEDLRVCGLLVSNEYNVFYFTGFRGPGILVYTRSQGFTLLVPPLEYLRALRSIEESGIEDIVEIAVFYPYRLPPKLVLGIGREPRIIADNAVGAVRHLLRDCREIGIDTRYSMLLGGISEDLKPVDIGKTVREWRMVKEPWEIERISEATRIAEIALQEAINALEVGVRESEIAGIIEYVLRVNGAEDHAFPPIVAFGENTAYPHHVSSSRILSRETPVLIDLGALYKGYNSDMTRTLWYGGRPDKYFREVAETVREAVDEAIDFLKPGITMEEVDAVARRVLARRGLDVYFNHSLGHGVGVAIHEEPRISPGNKIEAKKGMVVTIEPGVYIPGKWGVRIEELVVVTSRKARRITVFETTLW